MMNNELSNNAEVGTNESGGRQHKRENVVGKRYNRLTVVADAEDYVCKKTGKHSRRVLCSCDCGNTVTALLSHIKDGYTKSCGCLYIESRTTHGGSRSRLYSIWRKMRTRCESPNFKQYNDYGGRGITVCDEWKTDFKKFQDWALENGYSDCLTIDRIDVNGNYEPKNCRWVDMKEQGNNRRNNVRIYYNGETKTIQQWADSLGMYRSGLSHRLNAGWSIDDALTKKSLRGGKNGRT